MSSELLSKCWLPSQMQRSRSHCNKYVLPMHSIYCVCSCMQAVNRMLMTLMHSCLCVLLMTNPFRCASQNYFSFLLDCGCTCLVSIRNRNEILEAVWLHRTHYAFHLCWSISVARMTERSAWILSVNVVLKPLSATKSQGITANVMLNLFVPCFSDSNKRVVEEYIMHNFCTQLKKCKDGAAPFTYINILIFITSASAISPLGLIPMPTISFRQKQGYSLHLAALMSFGYHTACRSTLK